MKPAPILRTLPDRVRQVVCFELLGLFLVTPFFSAFSDESALSSAGLLALLSLIAAIWNGLYSTAFDWADAYFSGRKADCRPQWLRLIHALCFEGGLLVLTLPVIMRWMQLGFWDALLTDIGLAATYVAYAWLFNWLYDRIYPIADPSPKPER